MIAVSPRPTKVAIVLSGCGHLDGSEIRESIITFMHLESNGIEYKCFAPDVSFQVVNHITDQITKEKRSALEEASRLTRGQIAKLDDLQSRDFAALVIAGGFGAAKTLSDLGFGGHETVQPLKNIILDFYESKKLIMGICVAPAIIVSALKEQNISPVITLGAHANGKMVQKLGAIHKECEACDFLYDDKNRIISTPAYMCDGVTIPEISEGIGKSIELLAESVLQTQTVH